ncbi:MAG: tetratricopeptide repeat protein [Planctomycetes bacterium]|nr:tetratricopeptide repeat protein [Planctomycetota bacterium]
MTLAAETAYLFRHALLRDAAYELQPPSVRATLHAEAVQVFEGLFGPAAVADSRQHHASDMLVGEIALHAAAAAAYGREGMSARRDACLKRAGVLADRQYRHDDSDRYWTLLLERTESDADRVQALHRLGHLAMSRNRYGDGREFQQRALDAGERLAGADREAMKRVLANARVSLSYTHYWSGEIEEALKLAQQVADDAPDAGVRVVALRALGTFQLRGGKPAQAVETLHKALEALDESAHPSQRAEVLGTMALAELELGRIHESLAHFDEGIELAESVNFRRALANQTGNKAAALRALGREHEAMEQMRRSMQLAKEIGDRVTEAQALGNLCNVRSALGDIDGVEEDYRHVVAVARETGLRRPISLWVGNLGMFLSRQGRREEAEQNLDAALAIADEVGEPGLHGGWLCSYAVHFERYDERESALRYWRAGVNVLHEAAPGVLGEVVAAMRGLCTERGVDFETVFGA